MSLDVAEGIPAGSVISSSFRQIPDVPHHNHNAALCCCATLAASTLGSHGQKCTGIPAIAPKNGAAGTPHTAVV